MALLLRKLAVASDNDANVALLLSRSNGNAAHHDLMKLIRSAANEANEHCCYEELAHGHFKHYRFGLTRPWAHISFQPR